MAQKESPFGPGTEKNPQTESWAEKRNNVRFPQPGEVQAAIDALAADPDIGADPGAQIGYIQLSPQFVYRGPWDTAPGIHLLGPATLVPDYDDTAIFADNGTQIGTMGQPIYIDLRDQGSFSSDAVALSTAQATNGKYTDMDAASGAIVVVGDGTPGQTGLHFNDDGGLAITLGCKWSVLIQNTDIGIKGTVGTGSFITALRLSGTITTPDSVGIYHTGSNQMDVEWEGIMQMGSSIGSVAVKNDAGSYKSVFYRGRIFDCDLSESQLLAEGEKIHLDLYNNFVKNGEIQDAGDGAAEQLATIYRRGRVDFANLTNGVITRHIQGGAGVVHSVNGNNSLSVLDGSVRIDAGSLNASDATIDNIGTGVNSDTFTNSGGFDIVGVTDSDPNGNGSAFQLKVIDPDGNVGFIDAY